MRADRMSLSRDDEYTAAQVAHKRALRAGRRAPVVLSATIVCDFDRGRPFFVIYNLPQGLSYHRLAAEHILRLNDGWGARRSAPLKRDSPQKRMNIIITVDAN